MQSIYLCPSQLNAIPTKLMTLYTVNKANYILMLVLTKAVNEKFQQKSHIYQRSFG